MMPEGAVVFPNRYGTAPSLAIEGEGKTAIMLPGPPGELIPIFNEEIRPYLDRHIRENPRLSDIAAHFSFSPEHLIRLFRKTYGVTPHRYILQSRIRMAMILLRTTNTPVSRISEELGFSDPHHFSSAFQLSVGLRPSAYRKQENT